MWFLPPSSIDSCHGVCGLINLVPRPSSLVGKNKGEEGLVKLNNYPARACASKGLCDRSWCPYSSIYLQGLFSIFQNTHFQTPISAQEGFSSNLIAFSIP